MSSTYDAIDKSTEGAQSSMQRFLASRGFTKSGTAVGGNQALEANRVGQQGEAASSGFASSLQNALQYAFAAPGKATTTVAPGNTGTGALSGGLSSLIAQLNTAMAGG